MRVDEGSGSIMSIAATLKRPYWRVSGQMISSSLYLKHNCLVIQLSISSTLLYEILSPSFARFSTRDFFLVFEWTIRPTLTGRGGSFVFECPTNPSKRRLILTALNHSRCARFTTIELAFVERLSNLDFPSKINDTRFKSGRVTNDFCLFFERSPWKTSNNNFRTILVPFGKIKPSTFNVFWEHSTSLFPSSSAIVSTTHRPFLCSKNPGTSWRSSSFSLITFMFVIISSDAPRHFNLSWYNFLRSFRYKTGV